MDNDNLEPPWIPDEVLEWLEASVPPRTPTPGKSADFLWFEFGKRALVEHIARIHADQRKEAWEG